MKLTKKQKKELVVWKYFISSNYTKIKITNNDLKMFFEWSEQGLHKDQLGYGKIINGFQALVQGKKWTGIHMHEMYEPGILDGSVPYFVLLGGHRGEKLFPREVVDFMKKEMFKGRDADLIERIYQNILLTK